MGGSTSLADLDVAIVKATRHDKYPSEEKYIREILSLTCYSRAFISACVNTLSRRLNKTRSWAVALKTLVLIQRLLSEGDPAYEQEIFFSTRRGTRLFNLSDFRDNSKSNPWDFSSYVRTYALYLDEWLEYRMQSRRGKRSMFGLEDDDEEYRETESEREREKDREAVGRSTPLRDMAIEPLFSKMQHLQLLLERFLACRPTGEAKTHRIVIVSLYPIVKESFRIYHDITEILDILIDRFTELEMSSRIKVYDIFCHVGKLYDELDLFYSWCKSTGIARSSEYPEIEKIKQRKLEVMDEYIKEKSDSAQLRGAQSKMNEEVKKPKEEEKPKPEEKIPEPEIIRVVLKVHMHCDACAEEIKRRILKMKGVESAEPDLKNSQVSVKGVFEPAKLVEFVYKRTGKHAAIVKQEPEKKEKVEEAKDEKKAEEGDKEKKSDGGGEEIHTRRVTRHILSDYGTTPSACVVYM